MPTLASRQFRLSACQVPESWRVAMRANPALSLQRSHTNVHGLSKGSYPMHRALLGVLAGVSNKGIRPGADRPVKDACD
jgi:hypothetical protein